MARPQAVLDTHIHLADNWKSGLGGLENVWLPTEPENFQNLHWTEAKLLEENAAAGGQFDIQGFIFVECGNVPAVSEAKWVLEMAKSDTSKIVGVVANIPVPQGQAAVNDFLSGLEVEGQLPVELKGGRQVLLGDPMPAPDACLDPLYLQGLEALHARGLLWEWCCVPSAIPAIAKASAKMPSMTFVLDHLGRNNAGNDFDTWAPALEDLAKNPNVVAKLGAIEQWAVSDPEPYLDHALKVFGPERVLAESNWFVNSAMGDPYDLTFKRILDACHRAAYTQDQIDSVFVGNARRVYSLK
eukprot:m.181999 g.181999  ORF g.181999 m.181999 type:complete len:299 (-) comp15407_c0_seq1:102-998(-)